MEDRNIDLLSIENFVKDKYKFHIMFKIMLSEERLIYSDHENYIIGRSAKEYPVWIWTVDGISKEKIHEMLNLLEMFLDKDEVIITCKEELYHELSEMYNITTYFELGFLTCKKLNSTKISMGYFDRPNYSDKIALATFWKDLCKEENNIEIPFTSALMEVDNWLNSDKFYVWRNGMGKVVSIASYSVLGEQAKISHVYTPVEERRKGYSKSLVYTLTEKILNENLVPLLYTNYNYSISNEMYKKLGYESKGYLINFQIKR